MSFRRGIPPHNVYIKTHSSGFYINTSTSAIVHSKVSLTTMLIRGFVFTTYIFWLFCWKKLSIWLLTKVFLKLASLLQCHKSLWDNIKDFFKQIWHQYLSNVLKCMTFSIFTKIYPAANLRRNQTKTGAFQPDIGHRCF